MEKRLLCLLMVLCMVFSLFPVSAFAEEQIAEDFEWEEVEANIAEYPVFEYPEEEDFFEEPEYIEESDPVVLETVFEDLEAEDIFEEPEYVEEPVPAEEAPAFEYPEEADSFGETQYAEEMMHAEDEFYPESEPAWESETDPGLEVILDAEPATATADNALSLAGAFEYEVNDGKATITRYNGNDSHVTIPGTIEGFPVTSIGDYAFASCSDLVSIDLGNVTSIGQYAFSATGLTSVTIPSSVTSLGYGVFDSCYSMTSVDLGTLKHIPDYTFQSAGLKNVTIPTSVESIGEGAFLSCDRLTSIDLGSVTSIWERAFEGCLELKNITIPLSVTSIGPYVFSYAGLTSISIPNSVKTIGEGAFEGCSLETVHYLGTRAEWGALLNNNQNTGLSSDKVDFWASVTASAEPAAGGTVTGGGEFAENATATVTAAANKCYAFTNWTENGAVVSTNSSFSFTVTGDRALVAHFIISHTPGDPVHENEKAATCTEKGSYDEVVYCRDCKEKLSSTPKTVAALGHSYGEPSWSWTETESAKATFTCTRDKHTEAVNAVITSKTTAATYKAAGKTVYTASASFEGKTYTDTKNVNIPKLVLDKPANVKTSIVKNGIKVSWGTVKGAERYYVQRKVGTGTWAKVGYKDGTSFTDTNVTSGKKYSYRIRARVDTDQVNGAYAVSSCVAYVGVPTITGIQNAAKGIQLKWKAVAGAEKYQIYRKVGSGDWKKLKLVSGTSFTDTNVTSGKKYSYRMKCVNTEGKLVNTYSATKSITFVARPAISSATASTGKAVLKWSKIAGTTKYRIFRKGPGDSSWVKLGETKKLTYTDKTVSAETKYSYAIKAYNGTAKTWSAQSATKSVTTK